MQIDEKKALQDELPLPYKHRSCCEAVMLLGTVRVNPKWPLAQPEAGAASEQRQCKDD